MDKVEMAPCAADDEQALRARRRIEEALDEESSLLKARQNILRCFLSEWEGVHKNRAAEASEAVASYGEKLQRQATHALGRDVRMPGMLNYAERMEAFLRMSDSENLLRRVAQTIDAAERVIERGRHADCQAAVDDCAAFFSRRMAALEEVSVASAQSDNVVAAAQRMAKSLSTRLLGSRTALTDAELSIVDAFRSAMPTAGSDVVAVLSEDSREKVFEREMEEALARGCEQVALENRDMARAVEGSRLQVQGMQDFSGRIDVRVQDDFDDALALVREVRVAYATYVQIVRCNGMFSAFSFDEDDVRSDMFAQESDVCAGFAVKAANDMRERNSRRYLGVLDDDYAHHVRNFWDGFMALMVLACALVKADLTPLRAYFEDTLLAFSDRAYVLGARMDEEQLGDFCRQIGRLGEAEE